MLRKPPVSYAPPSLATARALPGDYVYVVEPSQRERRGSRFWRALARRRRLLFGIWLGVTALVALFLLLVPKSYTATAELVATAHGNSGTDSAPAATTLASQTDADLVVQAPIARAVLAQLGLRTNVATLLRRVRAAPLAGTALIAIEASWSDPATAANVANAFANAFVAEQRDLLNAQAQSSIAYLEEQMPAAKAHMQRAQAALAAFEQKSGITDLAQQTQSSIAAASALTSKQQSLQLDMAQAHAQLGTVKQQLASTPPTVIGQKSVAANPVSAQLAAQIASLNVQLTSAEKEYTNDYPLVIQLKSQIAEAQRELAAQPTSVVAGSQSVPNPLYQQLAQQAASLQAQISADRAQLTTVKSQIADAAPGLARLPATTNRVEELQRDAASATSVYQAMQQKYQDALLAQSTSLGDVAVSRQADALVYRMQPNLPFGVLLGALAGAVLAILGVLLAEFLDDRYRSEADVKERLGLPVLATIPLASGTAPAAGAAIPLEPLSVEAFYQLVAALRYSSSNPPRIIAFTGADSGSGTTTIALNTAISMGSMSARVLIVDADLRRPALHRALGIENGRGLSDVLVGVAPLDDAVVPTTHPNVAVLTSGRPTPNPVGLLQSVEFDRLLESARERFDFVVLDGPPLAAIVDGVVLGVKSEGTVLVVSAPNSEGRAVRAAVDKLRSVGCVNLLGVVLNAAPTERGSEAPSRVLGAAAPLELPGPEA